MYKISGYRQKGFPTVITRTVLQEFDSGKIRRIIDEKCGFLNYAQRMFLINQVLKKRDEIFSRFSKREIPIGELKPICEKVTEFYSEPAKRGILEGLAGKKGRKDFLPGLNDRMILSECIWLKEKEKKNVILITDDADFTAFAQGIKGTFEIAVETLL